MKKLVRDKIPEILEREDYPYVSVTRANTAEEKQRWALLKLMEETAEFIENPSIDELVDLFHVCWALAEAHGFNEYDVVIEGHEKHRKKGGFEEFYIVDFGDED